MYELPTVIIKHRYHLYTLYWNALLCIATKHQKNIINIYQTSVWCMIRIMPYMWLGIEVNAWSKSGFSWRHQVENSKPFWQLAIDLLNKSELLTITSIVISLTEKCVPLHFFGAEELWTEFGRPSPCFYGRSAVDGPCSRHLSSGLTTAYQLEMTAVFIRL